MIITRTPLRISLGGGGTDLPSYSDRYGALVVSAAINRYIFIAINRTFTNDYFLKYSALERVESIEDIEHPIVREAFLRHPVGPGIEMVSIADIPAGTGLGSSGAFTVGLLRALCAFRREHVTASSLAAEACEIEIEGLGRPVGKQDQYIAAFGGLTCMEFERDGGVRASPLAVSNETLRDLEEHLLMFFTGYSRAADVVLEEQKTKSEVGDRKMVENLHQIKELGLEVRKALETDDPLAFGRIMDRHWQHKKERSTAMTNPAIDSFYELAMSNGAVGGKLVGAGAGGFLLFYAEDQDALRVALAAEGLTEVRFTFDLDGSVVLVRD
ncbi:MAG TPA: galactokinase [Acidimicrobiales bacterium]|nr:galactokinase [Acidimicrobiales bacterium]